jgi:hypothetical protein
MPWRLARRLGWLVKSPVSVSIGPLTASEVAATADFEALAQETGLVEVWHRGETAIAHLPSPWLRKYDFHVGDRLEAMFVVNGEDSVEWRLGFSAQVPDDYFLLVLPEPAAPIQLTAGVLPARTLADRQTLGLSIAFSPIAARVRRGDVIGRLVLLHGDSLRANDGG